MPSDRRAFSSPIWRRRRARNITLPRCAFCRPFEQNDAVAANRLTRERKRSKGKAGQLLDVLQAGPLLIATKGDCSAGRAGARSPADAVNIIFRHIWQFEVDGVRYAFHIDPARRDIGRDKNPGVAGTEAGKGTPALGLRLVPMYGRGIETRLVEMPNQSVRW